ncbi:NAD-dependent epimerase/dehydratase family protein [Daejeonella lutea]|uniref:Nucleoside-diphosphate-sugar epimerase n=1 Tax=Daejeonella lutea TaxID=572036 RepID=A0A1T5D2J0_9SPHI|nr:NAD-dependent epimerase/dehydratase family protein [Daejeonella lutea]SKB65925.1 Nucleoside-diphosphate-sugar epimerase [Daejeonella lutea]
MVLVTGATGFLGSELVSQLLLKGEKVRAIKRSSSIIPLIIKNEHNIEWVDADLLDYFSLDEALVGIKNVYHCAALVSFAQKDKKQMMKVNVEGTSNLLNASVAHNVDKLLHVSSVAAVGDSKHNDLITEKNHWEFGAGQSSYSVSKYESEMEVFRAAAEGLNTVIVNPSIIIGRNAGSEGSGQLFEAIRKGLPYYPGGSFGYVDVTDVASAMIRLMESDISNERFIISAENWSYRDLFSEIATGLNKKQPAIALQPWMLNVARYGKGILSALSGKPNSLNKDTVRTAFKKQNYSNEKIKKALNLEFRSVRETIAEICKNYNTN